jgi:hypothetical protein
MSSSGRGGAKSPPKWYLLSQNWASLDNDTSGTLKDKKKLLQKKADEIREFFPSPEKFDDVKEDIINAIVEGLDEEDKLDFLLLIRKDSGDTNLDNFSKKIRRNYEKLYKLIFSQAPPSTRGGYGRVLSKYSALRSRISDLSEVKTTSDPHRSRKQDSREEDDDEDKDEDKDKGKDEDRRVDDRSPSPMSALTNMSTMMISDKIFDMERTMLGTSSHRTAANDQNRHEKASSSRFNFHERTASVASNAFASFTRKLSRNQLDVAGNGDHKIHPSFGVYASPSAIRSTGIHSSTFASAAMPSQSFFLAPEDVIERKRSASSHGESPLDEHVPAKRLVASPAPAYMNQIDSPVLMRSGSNTSSFHHQMSPRMSASRSAATFASQAPPANAIQYAPHYDANASGIRSYLPIPPGLNNNNNLPTISLSGPADGYGHQYASSSRPSPILHSSPNGPVLLSPYISPPTPYGNLTPVRLESFGSHVSCVNSCGLHDLPDDGTVLESPKSGSGDCPSPEQVNAVLRYLMQKSPKVGRK